MLKFLKSFLLHPGPKYSWKKVTLLILLSCFAISGSASACYLFYRYVKHMQTTSALGIVQAIIQTTPQSGSAYIPLQTFFFAETLELSADNPTILGSFDLDEAKKKLLSTHALKDISLKKMKPNLLLIQYVMRVPIAYLEDYTNTAVDDTGTIFPYAPFFPPRILPKIYLGDKRPSDPWGAQIDKNRFELIKNLTERLGSEKIERIDLSQSEAETSGKREIVIILIDGTHLRLNPKNTEQQLANYFVLKKKLLKNDSAALIDFRIQEVAYIQNN